MFESIVEVKMIYFVRYLLEHYFLLKYKRIETIRKEKNNCIEG